MDVLGLIDIPAWLLLLLLLISLLYIYGTRNFHIFAEMGVPGPKPLPLLGNAIAGNRMGFVEFTEDCIKKYGKTFGIYEGNHPMLYICDPDALRDLTVKDFNKFPNRRNFNIEKIADPPMSHALTLLKDDDWRHNRNTLTPTFSSGKLKKMVDPINQITEKLMTNLKQSADTGEPINVKQHTGAFTMDVIAAIAFGIDLDTKATPDDPFIKQARKFFDFSQLSPAFIVLFFFPHLMSYARTLGVQIIDLQAVDFFSKIVRQALQERRENQGKYFDFLQLMINAQKEAQTAGEAQTNHQEDGEPDKMDGESDLHWKDKRKGQGLSDSEILGAAILFFTAGYETTATGLVHALYHLAHNPDVLEKMTEEIDAQLPDHKAPSYDDIAVMPYLDMVVMETMRINPPIGRMDRLCERETEFRGLKIPAGVGIALPIYAVHHDPDYWSNPEKFDPERFTPERKEKLHPLQWIPFGYGPRNCIGMRLALMEMKIYLIKFLQKYSVTTNSKTEPLKFSNSPLLSMEKGVWLTVQNRK